jgi:protein phosphatase
VSSGEIGTVLTATADPADAMHELVALADEAGAPDNVSAIVIDVRDPGDSPHPAEPVTLGAAAAAVTR